ncbi:MAG: glycosyltransferase family 2 protein [Candidatus Eisenbacteria bacterium]
MSPHRPIAESSDPISIVIPTYNRIKTLRQVIDSYLSQARVGEIVIVDDAGTDDTGTFVDELAADDPRIRYVRNEARKGSPTARNVGVAHSTGAYVLFGEDDLRFEPDYALRLMECLEATGAGLAAGRILYPFPGESDADAMARTAHPVEPRVDRKKLFFDASGPAPGPIAVPFIHAIFMVRREVFAKVSFDAGYEGNAYREETDFCLRVGQEGYSLMFCPTAVCVHLPREVVQLGGQMATGIWRYKVWSLRNNHRFLNRHYDYLRRTGVVTDSKLSLLWSFAFSELRKIPSFYLRRYTPGAYAALARRFSK